MKEHPAYPSPPPRGEAGWGLILFLILLLPGCIKDDRSGCPEGLRIEFSFAAGAVEVEEVNRVDLYIFDSDGVFVDVVTDYQPDFSTTYFMRLPLLPAGEYRFVMWGGLGDDYSIRPETFIPGETLLSEAMLVFNRGDDGSVDIPPDPLFHALLENVPVTGDKDQIIVLPVEQNTNRIVVMIDDYSDRVYRISITDDNGSYAFDNSFIAGNRIEYVQTTERLGGTAQAELTVLRLDRNRKPLMNIYPEETPQPAYSPVRRQEPKPLVTIDLIELFNLIPGINYRTMHRFEIRLGLTGSAVNITINGWQVQEEGGGVLF